jgi:hypothetical protein
MARPAARIATARHRLLHDRSRQYTLADCIRSGKSSRTIDRSCRRPIEREASVVLEEIRVRNEASRREILNRPGCSPCDRPAVDPLYFQTYQSYQARKREVRHPTSLIVVDEADRLQMNSLEEMRGSLLRSNASSASMTPKLSRSKSSKRLATASSSVKLEPVSELRQQILTLYDK